RRDCRLLARLRVCCEWHASDAALREGGGSCIALDLLIGRFELFSWDFPRHQAIVRRDDVIARENLLKFLHSLGIAFEDKPLGAGDFENARIPVRGVELDGFEDFAAAVFGHWYFSFLRGALALDGVLRGNCGLALQHRSSAFIASQIRGPSSSAVIAASMIPTMATSFSSCVSTRLKTWRLRGIISAKVWIVSRTRLIRRPHRQIALSRSDPKESGRALSVPGRPARSPKRDAARTAIARKSVDVATIARPSCRTEPCWSRCEPRRSSVCLPPQKCGDVEQVAGFRLDALAEFVSQFGKFAIGLAPRARRQIAPIREPEVLFEPSGDPPAPFVAGVIGRRGGGRRLRARAFSLAPAPVSPRRGPVRFHAVLARAAEPIIAVFRGDSVRIEAQRSREFSIFLARLPIARQTRASFFGTLAREFFYPCP